MYADREIKTVLYDACATHDTLKSTRLFSDNDSNVAIGLDIAVEKAARIRDLANVALEKAWQAYYAFYVTCVAKHHFEPSLAVGNGIRDMALHYIDTAGILCDVSVLRIIEYFESNFKGKQSAVSYNRLMAWMQRKGYRFTSYDYGEVEQCRE